MYTPSPSFHYSTRSGMITSDKHLVICRMSTPSRKYPICAEYDLTKVSHATAERILRLLELPNVKKEMNLSADFTMNCFFYWGTPVDESIPDFGIDSFRAQAPQSAPVPEFDKPTLRAPQVETMDAGVVLYSFETGITSEGVNSDFVKDIPAAPVFLTDARVLDVPPGSPSWFNLKCPACRGGIPHVRAEHDRIVLLEPRDPRENGYVKNITIAHNAAKSYEARNETSTGNYDRQSYTRHVEGN